MDIRSIIDSDTSNSTSSRSALDQQSEQRPEYRHHSQSSQSAYVARPPAYNGRRETRPPQPPPLQPLAHNDWRSPGSSSYSSAPSPYQQTASSTPGSGQYPFPHPSSQSPAHSFHPSPYQQREVNASSIDSRHQIYGQSTQLPQTPTVTTPTSSHSYSHQQRPQSSHSVSTPTSGRHQVSSLLRDNSQAPHPQIRGLSQPHANQQYLSQPGPPLGPPSTYGRPQLNLRRESSGPYDHQRSHSSGSFGHQSGSAPSPSTEIPESSGMPYGSQQSPPTSQTYINYNSRERSLSVSPKTRLPNQPSVETLNMYSDQSRPLSVQVTPAKRKVGQAGSDDDCSFVQPQKQRQPRTSSVGVNSMLNGPPVDEVNKEIKDPFTPGRQSASSLAHIITESNNEPHAQRQQSQRVSSQTSTSAPGLGYMPTNLSRPVSRDMAPSGSSSATLLGQQPQTPQFPSNQQSPVPLSTPDPPPSAPVSVASDSKVPPESAMQTPAKTDASKTGPPYRMSPLRSVRKRPRPQEIPIYAQSARKIGHGTSGNLMMPNRRQLTGKSALTGKREPMEPKKLPSQGPAQPTKEETNGHPVLSNDVPLLPIQPQLGDRGPLGPWEPSFLNIITYDEVTRRISDFLFQEVVLRDDVGAGPAGGTPGPDAVLEIEAKIGHLIDKNTNDRLRLPVMTECVLDKRDPNLRIQFQSSMTEAQHRKLNQFLNRALVDSKPTLTKSRIPMDYIHKRECDTFYELSQAGALSLPSSIRAQMNPRHNKAKVRITTDQKTGEVKAKIVKVRVADIDVFSPLTAFDWRVSVNLEMNFEGDMRDLIEQTALEGKRPDRNKDRVSYKHLYYTIDLTQVTPADVSFKAEKEHELEVEVSAEEVKRQGLLLRDNRTDQYEDLIRGFADNVRILIRHCK